MPATLRHRVPFGTSSITEQNSFLYTMTFNNSAVVGLVLLVELKVLEHFPASILKTVFLGQTITL